MVSPIIREFMRDELEQSRQEGIQIGKETGEKIGQEIGQKIGEEIGELKAKKQVALNLWHMGVTIERISQVLEAEKEQVEAWISEQ